MKNSKNWQIKLGIFLMIFSGVFFCCHVYYSAFRFTHKNKGNCINRQFYFNGNCILEWRVTGWQGTFYQIQKSDESEKLVPKKQIQRK
jgi:hypothetical protein